MVNHLISWLDRTLQFSKCEVEEENLKLENQDVFIHLQILSIRIDLYYLEVHKKKHKNHRHGGILHWICGLPFKKPGKLHTHFRRPIPHLALCLGLWNHRFAWSHECMVFIVDEFSPKCHGSLKISKKKCHMEIVSNPLNCSWWFPLIFPPRFPKSSLRICRILKGFSSYLRIWILPFTVTKSCLHWKQKDCHLQSFTAFRHWKIVVFYLLKFPQWFFS